MFIDHHHMDVDPYPDGDVPTQPFFSDEDEDEDEDDDHPSGPPTPPEIGEPNTFDEEIRALFADQLCALVKGQINKADVEKLKVLYKEFDILLEIFISINSPKKDLVKTPFSPGNLSPRTGMPYDQYSYNLFGAQYL